MESFLYYLLRASVLMALFYGFYKLFFAKTTFHSINRFLLIAIALITLVLPFFRFRLIPEKEANPLVLDNLPIDFSVLPVIEAGETGLTVEIPWIPFLMGLFVAGLLFTLVRYLIGLSQVIAIIRRSEKQELADRTVLCVTDENISPFSWMKYIVLTREELSDDNMAVIRHEKAHVCSRHSFDMIFFDLFTCLFWFNPFSWLLRREVRVVHEYHADKRVLEKGINPKQYQLLLIRESVGKYKFALANNFHRRDLHKRITMMMKNKTNNRMKWSYAMALPVLLLAMVALSIPKLNAKVAGGEKFANDDTLKVMVSGWVKDKEDVIAGAIVSINGTNKGTITDMQGQFMIETTVGSTLRFSMIDYQSLEYAVNKAEDNLVIVLKPGDEPEAPDLLRSDDDGDKNKVIIRSNGDISLSSVLIIVDGEKMDSDFQLNSINPDDIESISVLKEQSAVDMYGDEGKNGVILITTKKEFVGVTTRNNVFHLIGLEGKEPLIFFDNKEITEKELSEIDQSIISGTIFFESREAIERFGEKGKDGAVVLYSRKKTPKKLSDATISIDDDKVKTEGFDDSNTVIIIDGKLASKMELENLDSKKIRVVNSDPIDNYPIIAEKYNVKGKERLVQVFTSK